MPIPFPPDTERLGPGVYIGGNRLIVVASEVLDYLGLPVTKETLEDVRISLEALAKKERIAGGCRWFSRCGSSYAPTSWDDFVSHMLEGGD